MSIASIQRWQHFKAKLNRFCLLGLSASLISCAGAPAGSALGRSDQSLNPVPPPNFTRGLLARRTATPLYPLRAKNLRIEGWVMLRFSVDENGEVISSTIDTVEEQPPGYFGLSAVTAARRLSFENTRGEIVEDVRYVFRYELEEQAQFRAPPPSDEIQFRELIPLRYITPYYPIAAESQEIEGYVVVRFTVTTRGVVEDIVVDEAEPAGVFDAEAISAAARLRFEPRLVFDAPVTVRDVLYRFDWRLPR